MRDRFLTLFAGIGLLVIIGWLLKVLMFVFLPLVIAVFISFLLNPLVAWLTRHKVPLSLAVALTLFLASCVLFLAGTMVLNSLVSFQDEFPRYENKIESMVTRARQIQKINIGPLNQERLQVELSRLSLSSAAGYILNSFFSFLTYLLFTLVFVIYFLVGSPKVAAKINQAFSPPQAATVNRALENITHQVQKYIWAKTLTSIVTGGMMIIVCLIYDVDFAITWGFFTFLLNFVPTIGVFFASIPPPLVALINSGSWITALWVALTLTAVMLALGNIIEPRILGESVNLSPLVALLALIFWGWLWGPAGMIIAVPLTSMFKFTCDHVGALRPLGVLMGAKA